MKHSLERSNQCKTCLICALWLEELELIRWLKSTLKYTLIVLLEGKVVN